MNIEKERKNTPSRLSFAVRCAAFAAGVVINSFGIAFITKAALGTSPISSLPYVLSLAFPLSLGGFSFIMNMLFIAAQFILMRGVIKPVQLLQILVNVVFSSAIDVSMSLLGWLNPSGIAARCLSLLAGCVILAFDLTLMLSAAALSLILFGRFNGIGAGTVVSALLVGRFVNLFNRCFKPLSALRGLKELASPAGPPPERRGLVTPF